MNISTVPFPKMDAPLRFYAIVPTADWVARLTDAGVETVQLRNKQLFGSFLYREIERSIAYTKDTNTRLFVNDYWVEAAECGAYGVHFGQDDLRHADLVIVKRAGLRLGVSAHNREELDFALSALPSYVMYSPANGAAADQDLAPLRDCVQHSGSTPVVAAGGITPDNARAVLDTGAASLAFGDTLLQSDNPEALVKTIQKLMS